MSAYLGRGRYDPSTNTMDALVDGVMMRRLVAYIDSRPRGGGRVWNEPVLALADNETVRYIGLGYPVVTTGAATPKRPDFVGGYCGDFRMDFGPDELNPNEGSK